MVKFEYRFIGSGKKPMMSFTINWSRLLACLGLRRHDEVLFQRDDSGDDEYDSTFSVVLHRNVD